MRSVWTLPCVRVRGDVIDYLSPSRKSPELALRRETLF